MIPPRGAASVSASAARRSFSPAAHSGSIEEEKEEEAALSISDQRTLYLVNIFIGNTARFLNSFSSICQDKLAVVHRRILRIDSNLSLLEAQLRSTSSKREFENKPHSESASSSSGPVT